MSPDLRLLRLHEWIKEITGKASCTLTPVSGDASFRRYFRFQLENVQYIAVDAPPEKEANQSFMHITHLLETAGLPVPHIHYSLLEFGYFVLDDFGDVLLLDTLDTENADAYYGSALETLTVIQQIPADSLPDYDQHLLRQEMEMFLSWFLDRLLSVQLSDASLQLLDEAFTHLINNALSQPQVFVHRDYHSRNLMLMDENWLGIIDFQDAVRGPVTYDAVSLLRDCYIQWPLDRTEAWALSYKNQLVKKNIIDDVKNEIFLKWFDLMGIQRHLKAIGIFSRLDLRDGKSSYLQDIPRTLDYIKTIAPRYPETAKLAEFIREMVAFKP